MKTKGGLFGSGLLFWAVAGLALLLTVGAPFLLPVLGAVEDNAAARRSKEAATEHMARAAEVDARSQAEIAKMYAEAGRDSIYADMNRAHPERWISEQLTKVLFVVAFMVAFCGIGLAVIYWQSPEMGDRILDSLASIKKGRTK